MILAILLTSLVISIVSLIYFYKYVETVISGEFDANTSGSKTLINGTAIVNTHMKAYYGGNDKFYTFITFSISSSGDLIPIGLNLTDSYYYKNKAFLDHKVNILSPPEMYCYDLIVVELKQNDNFTGISKINALYSTKGSGLIQNATIQIVITLIMPITMSNVDYEIRMPAIWVYVLIFMIIGLIFYGIIQTVNKIRFDRFYSEELKKKDEEFQEYLIEWKKKTLEDQTFD